MALRLRLSYLAIASILFLTAFTVGSQDAPSPTTSPQASAQPQPSPSATKRSVYESATVLKTTTRLVIVDVVASDHKDHPLTDLKREDFTILEDGREQHIAAFAFQHPIEATATAVASATPEPKLPEHVYTNTPRYKPTSALNILLLDALNTTAPHQAYARQQMIKFMEKIPAGRPVAIYTLGSKLTLIQEFTADPSALKEAMKKVKPGISPLLDNPAGGEDTQLLPTGAADSGLISPDALQGMMAFEQERVAFQTDIRVSYTLAALNGIARSLAGYPGRKNLIWISEAFPFSIDPNMELTSNSFAGTRDYSADVAEAANLLIDAQVAIYPIDARALEGYSMFNASNSGVDKFGRSMARNPSRIGASIQAESAALQNAHATMTDMAERTGGRAFYNRNDLDKAIEKSMDEGSTYYTLAYYPDNKDWNGKFRKIQVKVDRAGVKLRHRIGYYAVDPKMIAETDKKGQARKFGEALSLDSPSSTGLRFWAGVVSPSEKSPDLTVNFLIDANAISFDLQPDGRQHAELDCVVQAYSKGKLLRMEASTVRAALLPTTFDKARQQGFPCQRSIKLDPGTYFLRLGVRDNRTGLIGTTTAQATVVTPPAGIVNHHDDAPVKTDEKKP